jgi:hypothetical protein
MDGIRKVSRVHTQVFKNKTLAFPLFFFSLATKSNPALKPPAKPAVTGKLTKKAKQEKGAGQSLGSKC